MLLIAFFAIFGLTSAQKVINLNTLDTNPAENLILASGNASIYITASSDSTNCLDKIVFSTGGVNKTATEVMRTARFYPTTDLLRPWIVQGPVFVTISLALVELVALTGSIYLTSATQAYDKNCLVFDLTKDQTISTSNAQSTIVILNSQYSEFPYISSYISSWVQKIGQQVYIFQGVPSDVSSESSPIFSNPFKTSNSVAQVTNVENFNLNLPIFYLEVYGGVSFKISPQYVSIAGSRLSNEITTGFYMKSEKSTEANFQVHPLTGHSSNILGFNYIGDNIPANSYVTVGVRSLNGFASEHQFIGSNESYWQTNVGDPLTIKSTGTNWGQFYIQYYVIESQPIAT